jgi:hypothetical protein
MNYDYERKCDLRRRVQKAGALKGRRYKNKKGVPTFGTPREGNCCDAAEGWRAQSLPTGRQGRRYNGKPYSVRSIAPACILLP